MIVEDEPLAREVLETYISRTDDLQLVESCDDPNKAVQRIEKDTIDILFLDIEMPKGNGMTLLNTLPEKHLTILTTAYREYAIEAYDLGVIDYLVKPIRYERFKKAVDRAIDFLRAKKLNVEEVKPTTIILKSGTKSFLVPLHKISHVQGLKDYSIFFTEEKKYVVRGSIKNVFQMLPQGDFIRVHKSFVVSKSIIKLVNRNRIEFGEFQLPIGRAYREEVNKLIGAKPVD
jgi:DNA-binding LytR/AlgR family response regulator